MFSQGQSEEITKSFSEADIVAFAHASGDENPVHIDPDYAARSRFGKRIAHGMLVAGLISAVIGTRLPGPGTIYLGQELRFKAPVFIGDSITAKVEVVSVRPDKLILKLATTCTNQNGETVIEGQATVMAPRDETQKE